MVDWRSKRVLIVTLHYLNGVGGGVFASRAYINAFAEIFPNVTLLYPSAKNRYIQGINSKIKSIPVENRGSTLKKAIDLLLGKVHRFFDVLPSLLSKEKFDLVVFDNSRVSYRMIDCAHKHGAKVITIHHNCELEYNRDNNSGVLKPVIMHWTKKYEREAVIKSDLNLTLTEEDKTLLTNHYMSDAKIEVLGAFESSIVQHDKLTDTISCPKHFVITGNLSAKQTIDSLLPWLDKYYPILKREIPNSHLTIAGKNPPESIKAKCKQLGITLIPSPKEMAPILADADCYICPTALGGGLKLRVMDGFKAGLPVISHEVSARGYSRFKEADVLFTYHDANSFIDACKEMSKKELTKSKIVELYEQIFSFEAGVSRLKDCIS